MNTPATVNNPLVPSLFFFFNDTATTEIYTLSLHDALPIYSIHVDEPWERAVEGAFGSCLQSILVPTPDRSEEHTSELQSQSNLVCRLLLEKKNQPSSSERKTSPDSPAPLRARFLASSPPAR